jgi:hypothetical protein
VRANITDEAKDFKGELRAVFNKRSNRDVGLYYSDGNKWHKLGLLEDLILDPNTFKIEERSGRQMKISLDKLNSNKLRTLYMANKDIYLGELIDWENQFSWTKIKSSEELTIYERREMVASKLEVEGTLTIKGSLYIL